MKKDCKPIAVSKHSGENSPDPVEPNVPDVVPLGQSIPTMKLLVALNYLHNDCRPFDVRLLGRCPNALQTKMHRRLLALVTACDSPADVPIPAGRSGPEFIARLKELEQFAELNPMISDENYEAGFGDLTKGREEQEDLVVGNTVKAPMTKDAGPSPEMPYRSLDAERIKLTGAGKWNLSDHLHDELWLPYLEPRILHHGFSLDDSEIPDFSKEDKEENLKLAKLWSSKGLLAIFDEEPPGPYWSRVFNAYKNASQDRQEIEDMLMGQRGRYRGHRDICQLGT